MARWMIGAMPRRDAHGHTDRKRARRSECARIPKTCAVVPRQLRQAAQAILRAHVTGGGTGSARRAAFRKSRGAVPVIRLDALLKELSDV